MLDLDFRYLNCSTLGMWTFQLFNLASVLKSLREGEILKGGFNWERRNPINLKK
jgi:hypothetical protein